MNKKNRSPASLVDTSNGSVTAGRCTRGPVGRCVCSPRPSAHLFDTCPPQKLVSVLSWWHSRRDAETTPLVTPPSATTPAAAAAKSIPCCTMITFVAFSATMLVAFGVLAFAIWWVALHDRGPWLMLWTLFIALFCLLSTGLLLSVLVDEGKKCQQPAAAAVV